MVNTDIKVFFFFVGWGSILFFFFFFFKNAVLGLAFSDNPDHNANPKTAFCKKRQDRLRPRVLLTPEIKTTASSQNITEHT